MSTTRITPQGLVQPDSAPPAPNSKGNLFRGILAGALLGLAGGLSGPSEGPDAGAGQAFGRGMATAQNAQQQGVLNTLAGARENREQNESSARSDMYHAQAAVAMMNKLKIEQDLRYLPADKQ